MGTDAPCPVREAVVEMEGASECLHREPFGRDQVRFLPVGSDAHVSTFPLVPIHRPSRHHHHVQDDGPIPACPIPSSMEKKLPIPPPTDPSVLSRGVGGDPPACPCDAARKHRFEDTCRSSVEEKATFVAWKTRIERDEGGEETKRARTWKRKEWKLDDVSERATCWRGWVGHESA